MVQQASYKMMEYVPLLSALTAQVTGLLQLGKV